MFRMRPESEELAARFGEADRLAAP